MGNRDALLEAAIVCLRERGFGSTRARDVASLAGVSLGAIKYHFGSTEGLLNEALAETCRRWVSGFQSAMATDTAAGLAVATDAYQAFDANRALLAGFVEAFAHAQRSAAAREQLAGLYDELRRGVAAAMGHTGGQAESVASVLIALFDGLMIQWQLDPERCPPPDLLRQATSALAQLLT